jgi:hypothetical protein
MLGLSCLFSLLTIFTVGRTPWTGDQPLHTGQHKQTSVPRVGFELTTPALELALELAATVIGTLGLYSDGIAKTCCRSLVLLRGIEAVDRAHYSCM